MKNQVKSFTVILIKNEEGEGYILSLTFTMMDGEEREVTRLLKEPHFTVDMTGDAEDGEDRPKNHAQA